MANLKPALRNKKEDWSDEQIIELERLFPTHHNSEVGKKIGKSAKAVRAKAFILRLKKSNRYWQLVWEKWLLKNYPSLSVTELVDTFEVKFGVVKTKWALINKYRELKGLR